jgi:transglutaminase-like putative cysteine protease
MYMGMTKNSPQQFPTHRGPVLPRTQTRQTLQAIPSGIAGIETTLAAMRRFVEEYKTYPEVRELALSLTRGLPQKDFHGEARALFNFVKNSIRYVKDINGVETVQTPLKTLEYGQGDCDDKATVLAALLESLGHETRLYAVGFAPQNISHVLLECNINGEWIALETTEPVEFGWRPQFVQTERFA